MTIKLDELIHEGLTNKDTGDYRELLSDTKVVLVAYCTSDECCEEKVPKVGKDGNLEFYKIDYKTNKRTGVREYVRGTLMHVKKHSGFAQKDVKPGVEWCPDCGGALFWKRKKVRITSDKS